MTNLLKVHAADESAREQATETRAKIQEWADKYLPATEPEVIAPLAAADIKGIRSVGANALRTAAAWYAAQGEWAPQSQFAALLITLAASTRDLPILYPRETKNRELSYTFEGAVREFHKQFFKAGMQWNTQAEALASLAFIAPYKTPAYADHLLYKQCGTYNWKVSDARYSNRLYSDVDGSYYPDPQEQVNKTREMFADIYPWIAKAAFSDRDMSEQDRKYWQNQITGLASVLLFHYMEADGPWVAGFLTVEDAARLKFTRVRLGAYLATRSSDDGWVRAQVEHAKQRVAQATFEMYPNDVLWQSPYRGGVDSCMASKPSRYNTWDSHHPTDAYCSSYYGCGDNSLALLVSRDADGTVDGRGIVNLQSGSIVRWYGSAVAERVLRRSGVEVSNYHALEGSWLALIQQDGQFIHPYNDGELAYGRIEQDESRVYFSADSDLVCLQDTGGSSYMLEVHYCVDVDENRPEDEAHWQEFHQNYVTENATDDWACAVTGEYCPPEDRTTMEIHGVEVEVSDYFTTSRYQRSHLIPDGNGGWGIQDDGMREQFYDRYEVDDSIEDEDDEDEEAA